MPPNRNEPADDVEAHVEAILAAFVETSAVFEHQLVEHRGKGEGENASGDGQTAADLWMDEVLFDALSGIPAVGEYASEERPDVVDVGEGLAVATDPLDGSSNLSVNNTVGTVVGVYDASLPAAGADLVAAAFLLYGPMTTMTVATESSPVERRVLRDGEVVDVEPVAVSDGGDVAGIAGETDAWSPELRSFVDDLRQDHKLRYTGAMVADVANVLARGGLAAYPAMATSPDGVLRQQYESIPIAYVVERAGGGSTTGDGSILDADAGGLHDRQPAFFGSPPLIEDLEAALE